MDQRSQIKVIEAGFSIVRCDDSPNIRIKIRNQQHRNWTTFGQYATIEERDRRFKRLLLNSKFLSD